MKASSLVGGVRSLEQRADTVLAESKLDGDYSVVANGLDQLVTICTIDTLLASSTPLPVPDDSPSTAETEIVTTLLSSLYEHGKLAKGEIKDSLWTRAVDTERVTVVSHYLHIPLDAVDQFRYNWRPVLRLLEEKIAAVLPKFERIVARLEGPGPGGNALRTWQSGVEMLRETRNAIKVKLARQERLRRLFSRPSRKPAKFGTWTISRITDVKSDP